MYPHWFYYLSVFGTVSIPQSLIKEMQSPWPFPSIATCTDHSRTGNDVWLRLLGTQVEQNQGLFPLTSFPARADRGIKGNDVKLNFIPLHLDQ